MKNYIYIVFTITLLASCDTDNFLDVKPTGVVIPQTVQDFEQLLNNPTASQNLGYWSNLEYIDPDIFLNDELFNRLGASDLPEIKQYQWQGDLYLGDDDDLDWNRSYAKIYIYNSIIKGIDNASLDGGMSEGDRTRVKGEAYAQRAMEYFILANEYGPAYSNSNREGESIPMPLTPDINAQLSKETIGVVFDQILSDLQTAESLFVNAPAIRTNANFRPGKASVKGLLAMVSLHRGEFNNAKTYANEALALYDFLYDFTTFENNISGDAWSGVNNPDFIFSIDDQSILWSRVNKREFSYPYNGHLFTPELLAIFDQVNDQRFTLFNSRQISSFTGPISDVSPHFSYAGTDKTSQAGLTVGNLLLVKAEASIRDNDKASAIDALNTLLANRIVGYTALTDGDFADNNAVLERVKQERRKELIGTGYYVVDLKRYHALGEIIPTFSRTIDGEIYTLEPGSSKYIVSVPPKVQALNPNL